mgnify:FL=1|tara:strand:+ start:1009 stop:1872 length:864 start_codon:yes stop_codon:yes gene_type:complete
MIPQNDTNSKSLKNGLYLVSTPIGNLADITFRAIEVLKNSDYILCEDTRISKRLLNKYKISSNLIPYHKFNETKNLKKIIQILKLNKIVSIISDAGTPTISDPGRVLIKECIKKGIEIFPIPGASAVTSAVSISGFSDRYYFLGFFPEKQKEILNQLQIISNLNCSIVFFISSKKFNKIIKSLKVFFSDREIVIAREISKFFEEFIRTKVEGLESFEKELKGELTVVISEKYKNKNTSNKLSESDKKYIKKMIKTSSIKDITSLISLNTDISKKEIYNYCLKLKNEK